MDFGTAYFFDESLFNQDTVRSINQFKSKYMEDLINQRKSRATFVGTAE